MDPDQTAPVDLGPLCLPLCLETFSDAVILLAFYGLNNVFCVYTEVMAQDDTVTFE